MHCCKDRSLSYNCLSKYAAAGKRDLPAQLRQRFTELYVPEMTERSDLEQLIHSYLRPATQNVPADAIVDFYLTARLEAVCIKLYFKLFSLQDRKPASPQNFNLLDM